MKKYIYEIILGIFITSYIVLFSWLSINRYLSLNSHYFDLGIMNQVVYNTSRGHFLEMTNQDFQTNISRLAIHFDPILAIFAPFYWIYRGPEVLLIGQTIFIALGAFFVYKIAKYFLHDKPRSLIFALSYLAFFPQGRANLFDFHAVVLATTFILAAIYFGLVKKSAYCIFFIVLALLTKENVGLVTFLYGLYLIFLQKERKTGLWISAISLIFFLSSVFLIIPYFREQSHFALKYFGNFQDPIFLIKSFFRLENLQYLGSLLFAHSIFIIFSPWEILIAIPEFLINLLSTNLNMKSTYFHYNALIVPFIFFSSIKGYSRLAQKFKDRERLNLLFIGFILLNLVSVILYTPFPIPKLQQAEWPKPVDKQKLLIIKKWQDKLGSEVPVSTTPRLAPFFTSRRYYYNFLFDPSYPTYGYTTEQILSNIDSYRRANYVIVDTSEFQTGDWDIPGRFHKHLVNNKSFERIYMQGEIEVYRKNY